MTTHTYNPDDIMVKIGGGEPMQANRVDWVPPKNHAAEVQRTGITINGGDQVQMQKMFGRCKPCKRKNRCNRNMRRKCPVWNNHGIIIEGIPYKK